MKTASDEHKCPAMEKALKIEVEGYGLAVTGISRSKDGFWRGYNGEYDVVFRLLSVVWPRTR